MVGFECQLVVMSVVVTDYNGKSQALLGRDRLKFDPKTPIILSEIH